MSESPENFDASFPFLEAEGDAMIETGNRFFNQFHHVGFAYNELKIAINEWMKASESVDSPEVLVKLAQAYLLNGQLPQAQKYINKVFEVPNLAPQTFRTALKTKALLLYRQSEFQLAENALRTARQFERPWHQAKIYLGLASIGWEKTKTNPSVKSYVSCFANLLLGTSLYCVTEPLVTKKALVHFYGLKLIASFIAPSRLLDCYLGLFQVYPGLELLPIEIGHLYLQQDQFDEAEYWFNKAIDRHPCKDEGYQGLAQLYQITENNELLVDTLKRWLAVRPNYGELLLTLSQALSTNPETIEEALSYAKQSLLFLNTSEQKARAYAHLGNLYQTSYSTLDAAAMAYQAAIGLFPDDLETYVALGTLYYDKEDYALSQQVFERALKLSPESPKILCNLGYLAWMQGNVSQAEAYYQRSVYYDPTYDIALNNLGVLYLDHIGDIEKAMALFEQTLYYSPNYALCHYNKGRAYSFLGMSVEAAKSFMVAQELNVQGNELDDRELTERIKSLFDEPTRVHPID